MAQFGVVFELVHCWYNKKTSSLVDAKVENKQYKNQILLVCISTEKFNKFLITHSHYNATSFLHRGLTEHSKRHWAHGSATAVLLWAGTPPETKGPGATTHTVGWRPERVLALHGVLSHCQCNREGSLLVTLTFCILKAIILYSSYWWCLPNCSGSIPEWHIYHCLSPFL